MYIHVVYITGFHSNINHKLDQIQCIMLVIQEHVHFRIAYMCSCANLNQLLVVVVLYNYHSITCSLVNTGR